MYLVLILLTACITPACFCVHARYILSCWLAISCKHTLSLSNLILHGIRSWDNLVQPWPSSYTTVPLQSPSDFYFDCPDEWVKWKALWAVLPSIQIISRSKERQISILLYSLRKMPKMYYHLQAFLKIWNNDKLRRFLLSQKECDLWTCLV